MRDRNYLVECDCCGQDYTVTPDQMLSIDADGVSPHYCAVCDADEGSCCSRRADEDKASARAEDQAADVRQAVRDREDLTR